MKQKGYFQLSWGKVIISIMLTIVWVFFQRIWTGSLMCKVCSVDVLEGCKNYFGWLAVQKCECCVAFFDVIVNYLNYVVVPFIVIYILYSLLAMFISRHQIPNHHNQPFKD